MQLIVLFLHLWDLSVLVNFTRRFCRNQLAARLQALIQGSMTLSAAQFHCVTGFSARHGVSQLTERTANVFVPASINVHETDCPFCSGTIRLSTHRQTLTAMIGLWTCGSWKPDCFLATSLDHCSTVDEVLLHCR